MITEYHRPESLEDALALISRQEPHTIPLGGGLYINEVIKDPVAVADLQGLGLDSIKKQGSSLQIGAGTTLQALLESGSISPALAGAIKHQENYNRRQVATLAGSLVAAGGRSAVAAVLLAHDAELMLVGAGGQQERIKLGDLLPVRKEALAGRLITQIQLPADLKAAYQYVSRSPADLPIVGAAAAQWPSGRTRVVLLGFGSQPTMVFDGPDAAGADLAAGDAYSEAEDQWASADYRSEAAAVLVRRCLDQITGNQEG